MLSSFFLKAARTARPAMLTAYAAAYAARKGHDEIVGLLVKEDDFLLFAKAGDLKGVKIAVERAKIDLEVKSVDGYTALLYAAAKNHRKVVKYLLKAGADPAEDNDGISILQYAERKSTRRL